MWKISEEASVFADLVVWSDKSLLSNIYFVIFFVIGWF